jgi:hypothetical protein
MKHVPMEMTAKNEVSTRIFTLETNFVGHFLVNLVDPILLHVFLQGALHSSN